MNRASSHFTQGDFLIKSFLFPRSGGLKYRRFHIRLGVIRSLAHRVCRRKLVLPRQPLLALGRTTSPEPLFCHSLFFGER